MLQDIQNLPLTLFLIAYESRPWVSLRPYSSYLRFVLNELQELPHCILPDWISIDKDTCLHCICLLCDKMLIDTCTRAHQLGFIPREQLENEINLHRTCMFNLFI